MAMNKQEIMEAIQTLGKSLPYSQGFYRYLYEFFKEHPEALERFEKQNLNNLIDLRSRFEG